MSLYSTEMGDHLEIIIFSSILLILLNSLISLTELHKTPSVTVYEIEACDWTTTLTTCKFQFVPRAPETSMSDASTADGMSASTSLTVWDPSFLIWKKGNFVMQSRLTWRKTHLPISGGSRISRRGRRACGGGGIYSRGGHTLKVLYVETKESGPL